MSILVGAYLRWCELLGLRVTKIQAWANSGAGQVLQVGELTLRTAPTFKMVGVVLGEDLAAATLAHFEPRLTNALAVVQRLRMLDLPASLCALLWRSDVLPRALYVCEVRDI